MIAALVGFNLASVARAVEPSKTDAVMEDRVQARIPDIEDLDRFVERDVSRRTMNACPGAFAACPHFEVSVKSESVQV